LLWLLVILHGEAVVAAAQVAASTMSEERVWITCVAYYPWSGA
jgi:hypothetical protein